MKIVVVGTGYVGLVTGVCLAEVGHKVVCVDIDEEKINMLQDGISPIYEKDLEDLIKRNSSNKRVTFTTNYKDSYKDADVIFIGVSTPEKFDGSANLTYVFKVAYQISKHITKNCLIVTKSTVPIGTNDDLEKYIQQNLEHNVNIEVASNPEFLSQGTAVEDTLKPNRIVIGVETKNSEYILKEIYEPFKRPIIITNRKSAEMIKYASNDFLALKISFINEIANLCELIGANIEDVAKGMSYDSRIGDKFLNAGIGYGGSCFPKDTKALHWLAENNGYELKTVKATINVNENQKFRLMKKAKKIITSFNNIKVAVLGLTFKPGTDDLREAPSIQNIKLLLEDGANIYAYDPVGVENYKKLFNDNIVYTKTPKEALKNAKVAFIFTEWQEIKNLSLLEYKELMQEAIIFDGRNCYSLEEAKFANVQYYSIGRIPIMPKDLLEEK